ncbi:MAG: SDR family oxidoreductase [Desulfobacteraceae bacterium]|jgi:NAD(P)-dependent dehydrogenase (short-subunit alcohol dehydrogenase family)
MTQQNLKEKVAVITGASRNMGRAFAESLGSEGAAVAVHYHSTSAKVEAEETASAVNSAGGKAFIIQADLTKVNEIETLFDQVTERFGRLDILINNAGMVIKKPFLAISEDDYDKIFAINSKAAFFCMREAAARMEENGRIINIGTSLLGATTGYYSIYAGSKAPLEDFTRALAKEVGARGITVNTIAPGPLNTSFFYPAETPEAIEWLKHQSINGQLGEVKDIAPLVKFLASPEARWITAQTIFINGGFLSR